MSLARPDGAAQRTWTEGDGSESTHAWTVGDAGDGPGFSLLSAASRNIRVRALTDADYLSINSEELDDMLGWSDLSRNMALARHHKVFHKVPLVNVQEEVNGVGKWGQTLMALG